MFVSHSKEGSRNTGLARTPIWLVLRVLLGSWGLEASGLWACFTLSAVSPGEAGGVCKEMPGRARG